MQKLFLRGPRKLNLELDVPLGKFDLFGLLSGANTSNFELSKVAQDF